MNWEDLQLWAKGEEGRIYDCVIESLRRLISSGLISVHDREVVVSGKLRKILYTVKKEKKIIWTLQPEASCFLDEDGPKPCGHPDFRFSSNTPDYDQYDYDIECKLVRIKRPGKNHNYCEYYITDGVKRFQEYIYAQSIPPMGMIIGYVQEGDILSLLEVINIEAAIRGFNKIDSSQEVKAGDVSNLSQDINRATETFILHHLWADLR